MLPASFQRPPNLFTQTFEIFRRRTAHKYRFRAKCGLGFPQNSFQTFDTIRSFLLNGRREERLSWREGVLAIQQASTIVDRHRIDAAQPISEPQWPSVHVIVLLAYRSSR